MINYTYNGKGTENFVKHDQEENAEYKKIKKIIQGEIEYILGDRRELLRLAVRSIIELLQLQPQKILALHYNRSKIHPENDEEPRKAEQLYEKMLENIPNKAITSVSDDVSACGQYLHKKNHQNLKMILERPSAHFCTKEEPTLYSPESKEIKRNLYKESLNISASIEMISYPYRRQAWHPNFDSAENGFTAINASN